MEGQRASSSRDRQSLRGARHGPRSSIPATRAAFENNSLEYEADRQSQRRARARGGDRRGQHRQDGRRHEWRRADRADRRRAGGDRSDDGRPRGGRGNDFARVMAIPESIEEGVALVAARTVRSIDVGEANGHRFLCIASCGFDSDANRIANETHYLGGGLVYAYAALRALIAWKPATLHCHRRRARCTSSPATPSRSGNGNALRWRHADRARGGDRRRSCSISITSEQTGKLRFLANLPKVFKGAHVEQPEVIELRARKESESRPTGRSRSSPTATTRPIFRRPCGVLPAALQVIAPPA